MLDFMRSLVIRGLRDGLRRLGFELRRIENWSEFQNQHVNEPYMEREEYGASNLRIKLERVSKGGAFEFPDIVNLNRAVVSCVTKEKRIVELGSGTGKFAAAVASDPSKFVVASEFDFEAHKWCLERIPARDNLVFLHGAVPVGMGPFDLSVSIDVVEHVKDFQNFLQEMSALAPRSIITTPNRKRSTSDFHAGPPNYYQHVREWTAGEFFWVLRCFWREVALYGLKNQDQPAFVKVNVDTSLSPLIAVCSSPLSGPFSSSIGAGRHDRQ